MLVALAAAGSLWVALWLVAMVSVLTNPGPYRNGSQLVWVLVLLFGGPAGVGLYFILARARRPVGTPEDIPPRRERAAAIAAPWFPPSPQP